MKIEDSWIDCNIWMVGFKVETRTIVIHKTLIFDTDYSKDEVSKIILTNFKDIKLIEYLELWSEYCLRTRDSKIEVL